MPLFFILSGYLWKNKNNNVFQIIKKNTFRYLIPYFIMCGINFIIQSGILLFTGEKIPVLKYMFGIFYSRGTLKYMPNCSPLWHLTAIFVSMTLWELLQTIKINNNTKKKIVCWIIVLAMGCISSMLSIFNIIKLLWNVDTAMMGIVFVGIGYEIKEMKLLDKIFNISIILKLLIITALFALGIVSIAFNPIESVDFDGNRYGNILLMLIGAAAISFDLFIVFYKTDIKPLSFALSFLGKHTLFIIGFDYLSKTLAVFLLNLLGLSHWGLVFVVKIVILLAGIAVWIFVIKMIPNKKAQRILSF